MGVRFYTSNSFFSNGSSNIQTGVNIKCRHNNDMLKMQIGVAFPDIKSILEKRFRFFNHCSKHVCLDLAFERMDTKCNYFTMVDFIYKQIQCTLLRGIRDRFCWCDLKIYYGNSLIRDYNEYEDSGSDD